MFYTLGVFERPFLRGFDGFYEMFVVPLPEWYDHILFALVRNLAGDHIFMAIGIDFRLESDVNCIFLPWRILRP